ncbi:Endoplasmic reticulum, stress-associated Ramp4 [Artemisia annua]|uniref:Endoplasmic reticulum, stress-associated Ramp4 n=1 Tax=Artemisia annua TaxID=35608 RepID=A0A2U1QAZ9_ARTAN|nr:Endoplasmic reticulum, stress-associated Ramp4 [Artemisia annua]
MKRKDGISIAARTCHMKINEGWPHPHCQQPGVRMAPNYTYNFKATLVDVTGSIVVTCFSPEANSLLLPVTELLSYVSDADPYTLPEIIRDLEHTKHIFTVHIAPGSRRGNTKYILEDAADAPQPTLPTAPPTVHQPLSPTTVTEQPPDTSPPETPPAELVEQELGIVSEMPATEITPPPGIDESIEKAAYHAESSSGPTRRQLFIEAPQETVEQTTEATQQESQEVTSALPEQPINEPQDTATTITDLPATLTVGQQTMTEPDSSPPNYIVSCRNDGKFDKNMAMLGSVRETSTKMGNNYPVGSVMIGFFVFVVI